MRSVPRRVPLLNELCSPSGQRVSLVTLSLGMSRASSVVREGTDAVKEEPAHSQVSDTYTEPYRAVRKETHAPWFHPHKVQSPTQQLVHLVIS